MGTQVVHAREMIVRAGLSASRINEDVAQRTLVSATGLSTGINTLRAGARIYARAVGCGQAITVLTGEAEAAIEGRLYTLGRFDCVHVPSNSTHSIANPSLSGETVLHWALASAHPPRMDPGEPHANGGVHVARFACLETYELSPGAIFRDLFAARFGSQGICGGYGEFQPGASLPCHTHLYDESITIIAGRAACMVQGRQYQLSDCDTALVPRGLPHRFLNRTKEPMAMLWVYAGNEPERVLVDARYCSGELVWP